MYQKTKILIDAILASSFYIIVLIILPIRYRIFPGLGGDTMLVPINAAINMSITAAFLYLLIRLIMRGKGAPAISYAWLLFFSVVIAVFLAGVGMTKDRLHFAGYGMLSVLLYRTLRHNICSERIYMYSGLITLFFSVTGEMLQATMLGVDTFEISDTALDLLGIMVAQSVIALVIRPRLEAIDIKVHRYTNRIGQIQDFLKERSSKNTQTKK